jgi:hypothetical protein
MVAGSVAELPVGEHWSYEAGRAYHQPGGVQHPQGVGRQVPATRTRSSVSVLARCGQTDLGTAMPPVATCRGIPLPPILVQVVGTEPDQRRIHQHLT